jgi:hypothetical protein
MFHYQRSLGLRNVMAAAAANGKFAVSTGRKLHFWKSPEPLQAFAAQVNASNLAVDPVDGFESMLSTEMVEEVDMNAEGDCFGLLGGSKLLGRTKTIVDLPSVTHLVASNPFILAQTSSGELYSYQRSVSTSTAQTAGSAAPASVSTDQIRPSMVKIPLELASPSERVRRVACGHQHAVAMTSAGVVYVWGSNEYGQLGLGDDYPLLDRQVNFPTKLELRVGNDVIDSDDESLSKCETLDVACGNDHTLVLTTDGQVLAFGCHWHGQLGLGEIDERTENEFVDGCSYLPTRVPIQRCGVDDGSDERTTFAANDQVYLITAQDDSSAAVTARGDVFQWGKCVPSGIASVCGLVSRWRPERVVELSDSSGLEATAPPRGPTPSWHSIAVARGVIVLSRHAESRNQDQ